jgi:PAS domain S-box-containing protein
MDLLTAFFGRHGYLPHGYCFTWSPTLLWSMVGSDAAIAFSYFSIPLAILRFIQKRAEPSLNRFGLLFGAFIFACGLTHAMEIWTIWRPDYGLQALSKVATAAISVVTAFSLWPLLPQALKIPSFGRLESVMRAHQAEAEMRRNAEGRLAEIQLSLAVTLASIDAGFLAIDRQGRVLRMNAVAETVLGWSEAEARGRSLWQVFDTVNRPPELLEKNPVDAMIEDGITVDRAQHVVAIARDGTRTALEVKAVPTDAGDGVVMGAAIVFRDVTRVLEAAAEADRLAAIVDSSYDAIIGKTLEGRITSWNAAAETLFGYRFDEVVGQSIELLIPQEREAEEALIMGEVRRGARIPSFDTVRLAKGGRRLEVSVTISPIRDALGTIVGASKIARDVTQQRRAEAALRDSEVKAHRLENENRKIQESTRLKNQFLANMSHELRTPLNAIIGFADLLEGGRVQPASPQYRSFVGHISSSGRHLLQLINDILDLSKVESGKLDFHPEAIDLARLFAEISEILQASWQRKQLTIEMEFSPALSDIRLDAARLKQVLYNYLSNAIKFTPEGGKIVVRAVEEGRARFRLEVEDDGIGIAAEDLPRLFTEFEQLDSGYDKKHQGTGLGLALTKRLVELQGGRVGVRSTLGQGSLFYLVLNRVHGTDLGPVRTSERAVEAQRSRWLVIGAVPGEDASLAPALAHAGIDVDWASTAMRALQYARETPYDAILLELSFKDRPGLGVLDRIRRQGPSRKSPVVAVTVASDHRTVAGFAVANILRKPIRSDEVAAAMSAITGVAGRQRKVMVIDDDGFALELMKTTLNALDIDTAAYLDGREALRAIEEARPDAIVLDLMMPEFDGFAVLDALQRLPAWRQTPVFIWTSMLLTDEEYAQLARSVSAILSKGGGALDPLIEGLRHRSQGLLNEPHGRPS